MAAHKMLLSGDEAVAYGALDAAVALGTGYPGTPSTEILENFSEIGGRAQWAPNEKVAMEVGLGAAYAGARALVTMKHVGLNVAVDPFFTAAYTGVSGGFVVVSADDPGMASSQNEQDNRHFAVAAGVPMLEPSDSQEAYDMLILGMEISERWNIPVMLRMTTRVCHSKTLVARRETPVESPGADFKRDIKGRVMIPAYARPAHARLRTKLAEMAAWNEEEGPNYVVAGEELMLGAVRQPGQASRKLHIKIGIVTSGISFVHVREAVPDVSVLKLGMTYPLPLERVRMFAASVDKCIVVEEGDPYLTDAFRAAGIQVETKPEMYRFGELNVTRVRRILANDTSPEPSPVPGKPPELCKGCSYRPTFEILNKLDCIVAGDIGCYTLGVLPPFSAIDTCVCMGASLGVGLGLRHVLPPEQAGRVVSVIGDSTFVHSGITGLVEMAYNPPPTGHILLILDNNTTAMTGQQEHPGTGRHLDHTPTQRLDYEKLANAIGIRNVHIIDVPRDPAAFEQLLVDSMNKPELTVIVAKKPCVLALPKIREYERLAEVAGALPGEASSCLNQ
jgi:indolepyruvate ferredoxin oxidoreductase, alpha subunit